MYDRLWRALPGPWQLKALCCLALALGALALLWYGVFPVVDRFMPGTEATTGP